MEKKIISILVFFLAIGLMIMPVQGEGLNLSGSSFVLMEEESGRILIDKDSQKRMPMASTTKIMTALIGLENGNLNDKVLIDGESATIEGSSIYLQEGELIKLKDLIYGLMLRSGNDAATAIAKHIAGSEDEFVLMMNKRAKEIGTKNTEFANPHGLSQKNHYSTAYDLALITREAMKNSDFRDIFNCKTYTAQRDKNSYFINKNKTLWEYEGGDGGKTGYTMEAGRCLVSSAKRNGMRLIAVSLNARNWFNDNYQLLDYGFEKYSPYMVYNKNQLIDKIKIPNGYEKLNIVTSKELFYPLKDDEKKEIKVKVSINEDLKAPIERGESVGNIETYLKGVLIRKDPLVARNSVRREGIFQKIIQRISQ